ncbi:hypothetical protein P153DRAFT_384100 [Dothidotthia symphoricarpi CBS 119687]|uniref:Integral membrane protein-like protein n=1 Tax=Dothidotthia symphoricarpi CBS 119687 TaxID=1392245 RepID=A0A6A6AKB3_9PLEO|nr:uncharacterized protein P153DRAFT_384100 [Dothidotthia symphoricarpi CBS 119687]KAF2130881.1 hypothetical protein P153DRAFT_384100 [Dothidotthia symphoricarpi CBS 119687]
MRRAILSQTLQGAVLSMTSNIIAQGISSYKHDTPFSLNYIQVLKFAIFSLLSSPPNILWQTRLEATFPTTVSTLYDPSEKKPTTPTKREISKTNVLIKFLLDQTIGAVINTLLFLAYMGYVNSGDWNVVAQNCRARLWPMMRDGYKFWPLISLISFVWVPVDKRIVFGCSVGVVWGIYLSLAVGA